MLPALDEDVRARSRWIPGAVDGAVDVADIEALVVRVNLLSALLERTISADDFVAMQLVETSQRRLDNIVQRREESARSREDDLQRAKGLIIATVVCVLLWTALGILVWWNA